MTDLGPLWPPVPLRTERLAFASPRRVIGRRSSSCSPRRKSAPGRRPGCFVADLDGAMIGMITLDRRDAEQLKPVRTDAGRVELGYLFLPSAWGRGYAAEACAAVLGWFDGVRPGEPVVLRTRTANERGRCLALKLSFTEVELFEAYGAEQWFGVRDHPTSR
ncbi:GNAT family N-acetyltransferase [Amycolatopsis sp. cg9]|uniref:GNAT family N-acetyltransferase n=1 Tax=Amycolatopsis sp. cg9 TaxID=3238801 RepID=UPI003523FC4B